MTDSSLLCYHKGCGQKYDPNKNESDSCQHHPGVPVFHDALKGWSCCKKRSTDFTEFLNIPGCTRGSHTNEKPAEPEPAKKEEKCPDIPEVKVSHPPPLPKTETVRPSEDVPMSRLKVTVGNTLKQALEKQMQQMNLDAKDEKEDKESSEVSVGTTCKNSGCGKGYEGEHTNKEDCFYHSGVPIFHEGMKYWSCCQRKTSDFDNFLDQEGCTNGKHVWFKKVDQSKNVACRFDWHQTAGFVTVSIFSKVALPDQSWVEVNAVKLTAHIVFEGGKSVFEKTLVLKGIIDPAKSSVKMLGTKVEISMKKAEPGSWSRLEFAQPFIPKQEEDSD